MYALLLTLFMSASVDCPVVIQLALDMDIKYTNTDYFVQYEQDCCLGYGVKCENGTVTELHWGFTLNYNKNVYPVVTFPSNLRVSDLNRSRKSLIIRQLPETLKVLNLINVLDIRLEMSALPNLTYFGMTQLK
eukprot:NODE_464_length_7114_cov_0.303350.p6 type:complete len:133 gc:universal NODE_464_length_7114_cov_0.303350:465-67(-)